MHPNDRVIKINDSSVITIENISSVKHKKIDWLWKNIIAYGKMTLFAGEPGVGKSQLLLYIASIVSLGKAFHCDGRLSEINNVLLISGEDNADDTIKPRLIALGADLSKIDYVKGIKRYDKNNNEYFDSICLIDNLADIEQNIIKRKYKLIIIDPISLYLGSIDENKNKEIRNALGIINALAERHNIAIILNSHFSKPSGGSNKNAIYRVMGSIGFAAAARIVFGVMKDPDDAERRLFLPIKNNIGQDKEGFVYKIKQCVLSEGIETSKIEWLQEKIDRTANEVLNATHTVELSSPVLQEVKDFLLEKLKNGSTPLTEIRRQATERGFSVDRLYKAKNELRIVEDLSINGRRGKIWYLPNITD